MSSPTDAVERLQNALRSADPNMAAFRRAQTLRDEGMRQGDLYLLYLDTYVLNTVDALEDALLDTLDCICGGPWAKGGDFYEQELTTEMMDEARRARATPRGEG